MALTANFTRDCVLMEATVESIREANNITEKVRSCNGKVISTEGLYFVVVFPTNKDADAFLQKIKPYVTEINAEHAKL